MTFGELAVTLRDFATARDWGQYHTPPALAAALVVEAAELLELFQWGATPDARRVGEEVADVVIYAVQVADAAGVDLGQAIRDKVAANARKYAAVRGD